MALITGVITVATAGTAVAGPSVAGHTFVYKALDSNTDLVFLGNDGSDDVDASTGFPLAPGEAVVLAVAPHKLRFDVTVSGEKIAWAQYARN